MKRPNKEYYHINIDDYQKTYIGKYAIDLEKYCDELEKVLDKAFSELQVIDERRMLAERQIENNYGEDYFFNKEQWKEWYLKDE